MIIQPTNYTTPLHFEDRPSQRQRSADLMATSADPVFISQAARDLLSTSPAMRSDATFSKLLSKSAHEDPVQAEKLAYDFSHSPDVQFLDFSDHINGTGPLRYAATGQPVTEESEAYFNSLSSVALQNKINLYNAEKAKGTPAAEIMDKIIGYIDALPARYQAMINWSGSKPADERQAGKDMQADSLPVGVKRMLEDMVDNPAFGAKYADGYASNVHTAAMTLPQYLQARGALEAGQKELLTAWQNIQGQGKSPAQSYMDLLNYELSLSKRYWNAQDPGHTMPNIRGFAEAKVAYLQQYIAGTQTPKTQ